MCRSERSRPETSLSTERVCELLGETRTSLTSTENLQYFEISAKSNVRLAKELAEFSLTI
jgi:hypothetical protein